jgi:hypothetical protein
MPKSMYSLPSTSDLRAAWPRAMQIGKGSAIRMSWLTPVGNTASNLGYNSADRGFFRMYASRIVSPIVAPLQFQRIDSSLLSLSETA